MADDRAMDDEEFQGIVSSMVDDARDYVDRVDEDRNRLTGVYNGDKYRDEVEGRSQVVTREARDTVRKVKPSIMRTLMGSDHPCRFQATSPEQQQMAQQATEYIRYVFEVDNPGYQEANSAVDDALIRKNGAFKVWYEDADPEPVSWENVSIEMAEQLEQLDEVEIDEIDVQLDEETGVETVNIEGRRIDGPGHVRIMSLPPEEVLFNDARSVAESPILGHRREMTKSDLIAMGYDEGDLDGVSFSSEGDDSPMGTSEARQARDQYAEIEPNDSTDDSQQKTTFYELYVNIDYDGDGIAECRKVCMAGEYTVLENEEHSRDEVPIIVFSAWPVAHSPVGESLVELVEDLQLISTSITRNTLNSLAQSTNPDLMVVENMVNLDDALNPEPGRVIRTQSVDSMRELTYQFVGKDTLPMMDRIERMVQQRTGITDASQGLDAKSMQSTTAQAIDAQQRAALGQVELLTRNIIETGFVPLYRLVLKMAIRYQRYDRLVQIAGQWQRMNPAYWDESLYPQPSHALGAGSDEQRQQALQQILEKQEQIIQVGGIQNNPLITAENYYNALNDLARLSGFKDPDRYFRNPATFQPPQQDEGPSPEEIKAQAEARKKQAEIRDMQEKNRLEQEKLQFEREKASASDDRLRDTETLKAMVDILKFQEEHNETVDWRRIQAMLDQDKQDDQLLSNERSEMMKAVLQQQQQQDRATNGGNSGTQ